MNCLNEVKEYLLFLEREQINATKKALEFFKKGKMQQAKICLERARSCKIALQQETYLKGVSK